MGRKKTRLTYVVRPELEFFYRRKPGDPVKRGTQVRSLFEFVVSGYKTGKFQIASDNGWQPVTENDFHEFWLARIFDLLDIMLRDHRAEFWVEFKNLFDAGVIKKQAFIEYLMNRDGKTAQEAIQYIGATFGMDEQTQKTYLSDITRRLKEKAQTPKRKAERKLISNKVNVK